MLDIGIIEDGAIAVAAGKFAGVGSTRKIVSDFVADEMIDADGRVVCPGLVDPHTHIVYAGDRLDEFELKIKGAAYLDILAAGGGIISTVEKTRAATVEQLVAFSASRLDQMLSCGTTTCEIKTGYGLDTQSELKMLEAIDQLNRTHPITIVPTFLAAHAVPPEYRENGDRYVDLICREMLQRAWRWFVASSFHGKVPFFCDVFCEKGAFTVEQSRKVLETAKSLGFRLKAHVGQFTDNGGSRMGMSLGATSIDHLDTVTDEDISSLANSNSVGVVIPTENFSAGRTQFAPARKLIDSGCAIALSTDFNPGSAPCPSLPTAMAIAARYQKLLPAECLNAATINAAYSVGLGDAAGSIEIDKRADLVVLDTQDYRQMVYEFGGNLVQGVFCGGRSAM